MPDMEKIKVVQFGLGPIGKSAAALALTKSRLELVGAIDIDPALLGKDLGEVLGREAVGVTVTDDAASALELARGGCAIHTTSSSVEAVSEQLERAAAHGVNVVSSTEELLYPVERTKAVFGRLDRAFSEAGASLLGAGVNPGFVMDSLPSFVSAVCHEVRRARVLRIVDAAKRRGPLQKKVGAGITVEEFGRLKKKGKLGHVGLLQSLFFLADSLGLRLDRAEESLDPVVAAREIKTEFAEVAPGKVAGIKNVGRGFRGEEEVVRLDLRMYVGAENPRDEIRIDGRPPMNLVIEGGTSGDLATCAVLVNAVPVVVAAKPGVRTMREVSLVHILGE